MEEKCERSFEKAPLGYKIKRINETFKAKMNEDLKRSGLTCSQYEILIYLVKNRDHEVNQQELCNALQVSHPTIIGLINRMEEKQLVARKVDPSNRRKRYVALLEKAERILQQARENQCRNDQLMLSGMSEEENEALNQLLTKVYDNMQSELFWS